MASPHRIFLTFLTAGTVGASVPSASSDPGPPIPFGDVADKATLRAEITGNSRDQLRISVSNTSPDAIRITIPAGLILKGNNGDRVVLLRSAEISVAGRATADADLPTAALSSRNSAGTQPFSVTADSEPKLAALLKLLSTNNDVPRATSQLVVLALLEDISFAQWEQFVSLQGGADRKAAGDIVQAIDALGLLREVAPGGSFALGRDNGLKLRALRNPVTRAKAVQLYGIAMPDDPGVPPAEAPNLKQLLHTQPGDNCPVCRMREKATRGAGDF